MPMISSTWNRPLFQSLFGVFMVGSLASASEGFQYFGEKIDYWTAPQPAQSKASEHSTPKEPAEAKPQSGSFEWSKYLDPNQKDFFKEGDYTPPEPFLEIVRNPSDANLKLWFAYIEKKNSLSKRLQERMQEYLAKKGGAIPETESAHLLAKAQALPQSAPDARRFRFRMYFDSKCPHCKRMMGTLQTLQAQGFLVEAKQIDNDPNGLVGLPIPADRAAPGEVQSKDIQSVPLLLVGDLKRQVVYRMTGYQSAADVLSAIQTQGGAP